MCVFEVILYEYVEMKLIYLFAGLRLYRMYKIIVWHVKHLKVIRKRRERAANKKLVNTSVPEPFCYIFIKIYCVNLSEVIIFLAVS